MLAPFQQVGASFLLGATVPGAVPARMLCDQPGTGKTVQAAAASGVRPWLPHVVQCPAGLRRHWRAELAAHAGRESVVADSADEAEAGAARVLASRCDPRPALVLSHDNLADAFARGAPALRRLLASGVVYNPDEAHRLKGRDSKRGQAARDAARLVHRGGGCSWWLTGTPMPRDPLDLWVLLKWAELDVATFGDVFAFARHFGGGTPDNGLTWYWPKVPPGGVARQLAGYVLRRLRRDVLPELPPQRVEVRLVEAEGAARRLLDQVAAAACASLGVRLDDVDHARDPVVAEGLAAEAARRMGEIAEARLEIAGAKVPAMLRRVEELEAEGRPFAVYSEHRAPVDALRGRPGWVVVTGDETDRQRKLAVDSFDAGEALRGLKQWPEGAPVSQIAYTGAGREGYSMARAARLVIVSSPWNADDEAQGIDRLNRFGRVDAPVVEKLVIAHPLELVAQKVLAAKRTRNAEALDAGAGEDGPLSVPSTEALPWASYTRRSLWQDCRFAHHVRYKIGARPAEHPDYRRLGVLFDVAVSARLVLWAERFAADRGASGVGPEADEAAAAAVREAAASHRWPQRDGSTEEDGRAALALSTRALHVFGFLSGRWEPYLVDGRPAVQLEVRVPLTPHHTGWAGWLQKVDLVAYDRATPDGKPRLAVVDFKCRTRQLAKSLADGQDDPQLMLYLRCCRAAGIPVELATRLEVKGKVPVEPRRLQSGKLSQDKSQPTTPELYRQAIARHGFSEADYAEHLEWLEREGPRMHSVVQCGRVDGALDAVWTDVLYDLFEMQRPDARPVRNLRPRPSSPCQSEAYRCEYKEVCTATLSGFSGPEQYVETLVKIGKLRRTGAHVDHADEQELEQEEIG